MSNVINKTTLQYITSESWPEYDPEKWINNPVLPDCEKKYWKVKDDEVVEMTKTEKGVVDAAIAVQEKEVQKEMLIMGKQQEISRAEAIQALKDEGVLDANGDIIGG